jgi:hypothetical protein
MTVSTPFLISSQNNLIPIQIRVHDLRGGGLELAEQSRWRNRELGKDDNPRPRGDSRWKRSAKVEEE